MRALVRREWEPEELIAAWTLLDDDWRLVGNKSGATRLGFSLILKFFEIEGRFPQHAGEVPKSAVDYVAGQVKVEPGLFAEYRWSGNTIEYHRAQIREVLGFREATRGDESELIEWLASEICPLVLTEDGARAAMPACCRKLRIEPPGRNKRILRGCRARFDREFCARIVARLMPEARPLGSAHRTASAPPRRAATERRPRRRSRRPCRTQGLPGVRHPHHHRRTAVTTPLTSTPTSALVARPRSESARFWGP